MEFIPEWKFKNRKLNGFSVNKSVYTNTQSNIAVAQRINSVCAL